MAKAELLEIQWQVGDKPSLGTAINAETHQQHPSFAGVRRLSGGNAVKETVHATNGRLTHPDNVLCDRTAGLPTGGDP
jgi:hypothetical protein